MQEKFNWHFIEDLVSQKRVAHPFYMMKGKSYYQECTTSEGYNSDKKEA